MTTIEQIRDALLAKAEADVAGLGKYLEGYKHGVGAYFQELQRILAEEQQEQQEPDDGQVKEKSSS